MLNDILTDTPAPHERDKFPAWFDRIHEALAKEQKDVSDWHVLGRLWWRMHPILSAWLAEINRNDIGTRRSRAGEQFEKPDEDLKKLYRRCVGYTSSLREYAEFTSSGSPDFPRTLEHERLEAHLVGQERKELDCAKAAERPHVDEYGWKYEPGIGAYTIKDDTSAKEA
jgi:hypothetical protein